MARRVASGCLVFHEGNCLLLRRSALEDTMQGIWEMPAGKIESNLDGSPRENAIRETFEEAGITLGDVSPLGEHLTEDKRFYGFLGVSDTDVVELSFEHDAYEWIPTPDILAMVGSGKLLVGHHTVYFLQNLLDDAENLIYESESFSSDDIRINYNSNCPACISIQGLIGKEKLETDPANTYWGGGAYQKEVEHLQMGVWPCSDCDGLGFNWLVIQETPVFIREKEPCYSCIETGMVFLHAPLLIGGVHENLLGRAASLLHDYNNNGNGNILEMGQDEECYECGGTGERDCYNCDGGTTDCYRCDGTGEIEDEKGEDEVCSDCDGTGEEVCSDCEGEDWCVECGGSGEFWNENLISGIKETYQDAIDYIYANANDSQVRYALNQLVQGLESGQLRTTSGSEMYNEANKKLYNDLHDALIYYVINTPNRPVPAEDTHHHAESFVAEKLPRGVVVESFKTTSKVYYNGKLYQQYSGRRHREKAESIAEWMMQKLSQNPRRFDYLRFGAESFEAEFISINNPFKYSHNYVENLEQDLNQAKRVIKMVREICNVNVNVDWQWASISPGEEFQNIVHIIDGRADLVASESFEAEERLPAIRKSSRRNTAYCIDNGNRNPLCESGYGMKKYGFGSVGEWNITCKECLREWKNMGEDEKIAIKDSWIKHNAESFEAEFISINNPSKYSHNYVENLEQELKRCYEVIDFLKNHVIDEDVYWIATCKPDAGGECSISIEGYEELMRLVKEGIVEIPDYSHATDELLLLRGCDCGITHEEWLESRNNFYDALNASFEAESTSKPHSVTISRSSNSEKKLMAVFEDSEGKKMKTTHFGQRGASDYTKHGEKKRMELYLERHAGKAPSYTTSSREDWKDPTTAGSLSRWILWNKPSLSASFNDFKKRFNLKGDLKVKKSAETFDAEIVEVEMACPKCNINGIFEQKEGRIGYKLFCKNCDYSEWHEWNSESFEAEEENAKKLREYEKTYGKKQAKIRMRLKKKIYKENSMGTKAGQWSARKSQKLKREYEAACERASLNPYKGRKTEKQDNLEDWSDQDWKTSSGKKSSKTGEPYFPAKAVAALKKKGLYAKAKRQKAKATKEGKQNARYSDDIRKVVTKYRAEDDFDEQGEPLEYSEDNRKMQEAAEKIIELLGKPDYTNSRRAIYSSLGESYTSDMVYVLEYDVLTNEGSSMGQRMARKLKQQGTEPWSVDRWTGSPEWPTYAAGPFHQERETFTITVSEANPVVESIVMDLYLYFADKYGVNGTGFEPTFSVAMDEEGNEVTADDLEIDTTWRDSLQGFESEETFGANSIVSLNHPNFLRFKYWKTNVPRLTYEEYLKANKLGYGLEKLIEIDSISEPCEHENTSVDDVYSFEESYNNRNGHTYYQVEIYWECPDCSRLGGGEFEFDQEDDYWGTDPSMYCIHWLNKTREGYVDPFTSGSWSSVFGAETFEAPMNSLNQRRQIPIPPLPEPYVCFGEIDSNCGNIIEENEEWLIKRLDGTYYVLCNTCVDNSPHFYLVCNACGDRFCEEDLYDDGTAEDRDIAEIIDTVICDNCADSDSFGAESKS